GRRARGDVGPARDGNLRLAGALRPQTSELRAVKGTWGGMTTRDRRFDPARSPALPVMARTPETRHGPGCTVSAAARLDGASPRPCARSAGSWRPPGSCPSRGKAHGHCPSEQKGESWELPKGHHAGGC